MKRTLTALVALFTLLIAGCSPEESDLGMNLMDPSTIYNGKTDTLYANAAYSIHDDSILTTGGTYNIVGWYSDPTFGKVSASIYTQIALQSDDQAVSLAGAVIDSAVLCLVKDAVFPNSDQARSLHFEIMPLAEDIEADSTYYGFHTLAVREGMKYFDETLTITPTDTLIRFRLGGDIASVLAQQASAADFLASVKGLRIRVIENDSDTGIVSFNFSATKTRLTAYYHYEGDTIEAQYTFVVGSGAKRFMHFEHDYTGSTVNGADSIDGSQRLYLEPYGGYNIQISFDSMLRAFHSAHPMAEIHYAELLLPLAAEAPAIHPDSLIAYSVGSDGKLTQVADQRYFQGGDGGYQNRGNYYRLRLSLHLQHLMYANGGKDYGTRLMLYFSRRTPGARTILNGYSTANPVKIALTYTEK